MYSNCDALLPVVAYKNIGMGCVIHLVYAYTLFLSFLVTSLATSEQVNRFSPTQPSNTIQSVEQRLYTQHGQSHLAADALNPDRLAPYTAEFQKSLYDSQHPASCSSADFVLFGGWGAGLGSEVHVGGQMLLCAWSLGRVFLWSGNVGRQFVHGPLGLNDTSGMSPFSSVGVTCEEGMHTMECLFRRPSNCTLEDARARPGFALFGSDKVCGRATTAVQWMPAELRAALAQQGLHTPEVSGRM
jgi:hypothetical protein